MKIILVIVCLIFAVLRFMQEPHGLQREDVFKDMSHVFVGGLFGAAIVTSWAYQTLRHDLRSQGVDEYISSIRSSWLFTEAVLLWALAIALTVVEVIAFFSMR